MAREVYTEKSSNMYKCRSLIDITEFELNNTKNCILQSVIDDTMKSKECWMGIDEAGRGPVLGPMVYASAFSPIACKEDLKEIGFADSKTLAEEQRDSLFNRLNSVPDKIGWMVNILSPHYLSTCMLRRCKYNLNEVSHDTAIDLIRRAIDSGIKVKEVYLDTVGPPEKYQKKLEEIFPGIAITVSKKADSLYSIVSAASICAKVARDKAVTSWKFKEPVVTEDSVGSGYPGDPKTKEFLLTNIDKVFGFPKIVRFSWSTASKLLEEKAAQVSWPDDDDEASTKAKKRKAVDSFFKSETDSSTNKYFSERKMSPLDCF